MQHACKRGEERSLTWPNEVESLYNERSTIQQTIYLPTYLPTYLFHMVPTPPLGDREGFAIYIPERGRLASQLSRGKCLDFYLYRVFNQGIIDLHLCIHSH